MYNSDNKQHEIYIYGCGGNIGCTEKLHMSLVDFSLNIDGKSYRFDQEPDGSLSILCIDGIEETTGVKHGYKNLIIHNRDSNYNPYNEERKKYLNAIQEAKEKGCKECSFRCDSPVYKMCECTGESFWDSIPEHSKKCPFNVNK